LARQATRLQAEDVQGGSVGSVSAAEADCYDDYTEDQPLSHPARKKSDDMAPAPRSDRDGRPMPLSDPEVGEAISVVDGEGTLRADKKTSLNVRLARFGRGVLKSVLPFVMVAAGYAGYQYLKSTRPEAPKQAQSERAFAVETKLVNRVTVQPKITLFGSTVAGRQVDIRALVAGRVIETNDELREGGFIKAGQTLLAIDPFDYKSALTEAKAQRAEVAARLGEQQASVASDKTSLENAKEQLELARSDLSRAEKLVGRGNLSERSLDDRRQIVLQRKQAADQLTNSIRVWESRITQTKVSGDRLDVAIARAEKRLAESELKAPFDAYVTEVGAQVGRMMSVNDKVATLIDTNWIEVRFSLTDSQFGRVAARGDALRGRDVEVHWSLGGQTFTYKAKITRVAARITSTNGGIDVFARVENPSKPVHLRPGAFVEVTLNDVPYEDVVTVPNTALYNGDTVYAVVDSRLDPRQVSLVATSGNDLLVRGNLQNGDAVVTTRMSTPGKGVLIKELSATDTAAGSGRSAREPANSSSGDAAKKAEGEPATRLQSENGMPSASGQRASNAR